MAILFEDQYQKIVNANYFFETDVTAVVLRCYATAADREKEKLYKELLNEIKTNIYDYVNQQAALILEEINSNTTIENITDKESFLQTYPQLKNKIELFESVRAEALLLQDKLLYQPIDFNALTHKSIWQNLGLCAEVCGVVNIIGNIEIFLQNINTNNLPTLYSEIKKKLKGTIIDC